MSGSPKYTFVDSGAERRRQAERERQERERRRRERERRRREAALTAARQAARQRVAATEQRMTALRRDAVAVGLTDVIERIRVEVSAVAQAVDAASDQAAVNAALRRLDRVERDLTGVRATVATRLRAAVADRLDALAALLAEAPTAERQRVDPAGVQEVDVLFDLARRGVTTDPAGSAARTDELATRLDRHLALVRERRAHDEERRAAAAHAVADLAARLEQVTGEARDAGVPLDQAPARAHLEALTGALRAGASDQVLAGAPRLANLLDTLEVELDRAVDALIERRELLASIVGGLGDLGFTVDQDSFGESSDGGLGLRAYRTDGAGLAVVVQPGPDGRSQVMYTTDAVQDELAEGRIAAGTACGSLESMIASIGEVARRDGFVPGEVHWDGDGRPPLRQHRPGPATGQTRSRGAGA